MVEKTPMTDPAVEYDKIPSPSPDALSKLIHQYLVHNCFSETAKSFAAAVDTKLTSTAPRKPAANSDMDIDEDKGHDVEMMDTETSAVSGMVGASGESGPMKTLDARKQLFGLITAGNISDAIAFCNSGFPSVLKGDCDESTDISFFLHCQQFIEYARTDAAEALKYAQEELGRFGTPESKYLEELQDVVALIAYTDPSNSPVAKYLSQDRREEVALKLNSFILQSDGLPPAPALELLVKHVTVMRDLLNTETSKDKKTSKVYPKFDFATFVHSQ